MAAPLSPSVSLTDLPDPDEVALRLRHLPGLVFLDSASANESRDHAARVSLIAARPARVLKGNVFAPDDLAALEAAFQEGRERTGMAPDFGLPGPGLYGYIGYEGDFVFGDYREVLGYDHRLDRWWEHGGLRQELTPEASADPGFCFSPTLLSRSTPGEFCRAVQLAQGEIECGNIYQVNLSHRFEGQVPANWDAFAFYRQLRARTAAPFAAYLDLGGRQILSSSPEQFLRISGRQVQTRPIKGTRPRFRDPERDEKSAFDLLTSPKEVAELIMITDLERNDLGQICEYGSVAVTELLVLERYPQVFHLVSTIQGTLRPEINPVAAVAACFPGGSITGAPKKRAREIIEALEEQPRGVYTGVIGCFGYQGESCFNIAIRTAVVEDGLLCYQVGAGIVADSIPELEWEETLHKAAGILQMCEEFPGRSSVG